MIQEGIRLAVEGKALSEEMAGDIMSEMMSGAATPSQVASFVTAMRMKGEKEEELRGFVTTMRKRSEKISAPAGAIDLCGTGGDGLGTFNISTIASFVVAATGVPVAKHGNRAISSRSGSADILAALGIPFDLEPPDVETCLNTTGIGFMFAPTFHKSMRNVMATRREIGIRTFFNVLGPMANPACVEHQLIGVYDPDLAPTIARVLSDLGAQRAMVVHGEGMDEITNLGTTKVAELSDGIVRSYEISPQTFGLDLAEPGEIKGGSALDNARIALSILKGEKSHRTDIVAMNSAAALYVAGRVPTLQEGFEMAMTSILTGSALAKLREFAIMTRSLETKMQMELDVSALRTRRILPEILKRRYPEICADLITEILGLAGGSDSLRGLDDELISNPTILSVLVLNRMRRVLNEENPLRPVHRSGSASLLDAISSAQGVAVIGEYKPSSPSAPALGIPPDPDHVADVYGSAGVTAVSVLVEPDFFCGSPELFSNFRSKLQIPLLYKDFVVIEKQVELAQRLGADAVLLIAKVLGPEHLDRLVHSCIFRGIEPLVEVHDVVDIKKLEASGCNDLIKLVGINRRDLRTLDVGLKQLEDLRELVGPEKAVVAESGIKSPQDIRNLQGFDAVLIGSMFMQADNLEKVVQEAVGVAMGVTR